jgi:manganese-dependent inorganic pyrophosphatase
MDCTVASYCYSWFKNSVDPGNTYIPIRCGALNDQTIEAFKRAGIDPPDLYKELLPLVEDIVLPNTYTLDENETILEAVRMLLERNISLVTVVDRSSSYRGIVSTNEITRFMLHQQSEQRPVYEFFTENFAKVIPGRIFKKGSETRFTAPIMSGSMPYRVSVERLKQLSRLPLLVVGNRKAILEFAVENQLPAVIITGLAEGEDPAMDVERYTGTIFISDIDTAESIRLLRLSSPVKTIMAEDVPKVDAGTLFDSAKVMLNRSELRGLPIFRGNTFIGTVTRRSFIERPRKKLILVDHNETAQSVKGSEEADILEIIDHHRFAAGKTRYPIYISAKPVGSTSTIVYQHFKHEDVPIPQDIALLLLSGIISDTVNLKSPTTTEEDRSALRYLCGATGINPEIYTRELFAQLTLLKKRDPKEVILSDFKEYEHEGIKLGIGQVEVSTLEDIPQLTGRFQQALAAVAAEKRLLWTMLLITDVVKQDSILITSGNLLLEQHFIYEQSEEGFYLLPHILSRKKQLLPEVMRVISLDR